MREEGGVAGGGVPLVARSWPRLIVCLETQSFGGSCRRLFCAATVGL